jgi:exonuclease VII large subunit
MNKDDAVALISKLAAVVEQFERRCDRISGDLRQLAQQLPAAARQSVDEQMTRLSAQLMERLKVGLDQPVQAYEQRLQNAGQQLQNASTTLAGQLQRAERLHKQLTWKVAALTLGSLALLWAGGAWLSKRYYDEIRANQLSAELLQAYNQADVTLCGKQLCAKVDAKGKRYGEYVPVKPR